jgi:hypothetical protein
MRLARNIVTGIVTFLVVVVIVGLLSAGTILNSFAKERALRAAGGSKGVSLFLGTFRYNILTNRISCDSLHVAYASESGDSLVLAANSFSCSDVNWFRIVLGSGISCGDLSLGGLRGHLLSTEEKKKADHAEEDGARKDSSAAAFASIRIGHLSLRGEEFLHATRLKEGLTYDTLGVVSLDVGDFEVESTSPKQLVRTVSKWNIELRVGRSAFGLPQSAYRIHFASAQISDRDSSIQLDSLRIAPVVSDGTFFADDHSGVTRYRASVGKIEVQGIDVRGLLGRQQYVARLVSVYRPFINILINKRPVEERRHTSESRAHDGADAAKMPNEILAGMQEKLYINSLSAKGGTVEYAELYPFSSKPAALRWSAVRLAASGISNRNSGVDSDASINASGLFQDTARMSVSMDLPLAQRSFSLTCRGEVDTLPLPSLNSFLEVAERIRLTSGRADNIMFSFSAANGRSKGTVRPRYRDLKLELLEKETGRNDGLPQKVGTLLVMTFKIRKDNVPGASDGVKEGSVQYVRQPDDPFFKFVWFSLRGGLGHVVGF